LGGPSSQDMPLGGRARRGHSRARLDWVGARAGASLFIMALRVWNGAEAIPATAPTVKAPHAEAETVICRAAPSVRRETSPCTGGHAIKVPCREGRGPRAE
jgi:hypothetical protein